MNDIELKVIAFMQKVNKTVMQMEDELYSDAQSDVAYFLKRMYEEAPNRPFSLRLSGIGRPICQQLMHKNNAEAIDDSWSFPLRMMYGAVIEGLTVSILRHAGVVIDEFQTHVKLPVEYRDRVTGKLDTISVPGTLDVVIDGKVYDIKSASSHAYTEKFKDYETLKQNDSFGYICQLFGYAKAKGLPAGGWIVIDKSSGDIKVVEVPTNQEADMRASMELIQYNVASIIENACEYRLFSPTEERAKGQPTGNKFLCTTCSYCKYHYNCWPELQHLTSYTNKAITRFYTEVTKRRGE